MISNILRHGRNQDWYGVLGLTHATTTASELKKAYRALSLRLHPDRPGGNNEYFARCAAAHDFSPDFEVR